MMWKPSGVARSAISPMVRAAVLLLALFMLPSIAHGQDLSPPLSFADTAPITVVWPAPIRVTVHNDTTDLVVARVQVTNLTDPDTDATLLADEVLLTVPPSISLPPAGESHLELPLAARVDPAPGAYTGYVVFSVPHRDAVLRRAVTVIVPQPAATPLPVPAVETWTINAIRILPFLDPICLRGFSFGCTLPVVGAGGELTAERWRAERWRAPRSPAGRSEAEQPLLGYLTNERGGGLAVSLRGTSATETTADQEGQVAAAATAPEPAQTGPLRDTGNARLALAFDSAYGPLPRWGFAGVYRGTLLFAAATSGSGEPNQTQATVSRVDLTVNVKDIVLWPIVVVALGVWAAREIQRHLTVHRSALDLLHRLDAAGKQFGQLRKSVYGYSVGADFLAKRQELEGRIRTWERAHYGQPTPAEQERLTRTILEPLAALESHVEIWATFRDRLDRLRRKMEYAAKPAIQQAEPPSDLTVEIKSSGLPYIPEPRFYTAARGLLQGSPMELAEVPTVALHIDQAADIAAVWSEYDQLVTLVRDGLRQLYNPTVDLSVDEEALLDRARQHLNSAARDLWESRDLSELRERETRAELVEARDIVQRLLDPFVYYAGADTAPRSVPAAPRSSGAAGKHPVSFGADDGSTVLDSFPSPIAASLQPMVRSYARLDAYSLPGFDVSRARPTAAATHPAAKPSASTHFISERMVMGAAFLVALIAGLHRYTTTQFGTSADYLVLFTWAFGAKVVLEMANVVLSGRFPRIGARD